MPQVTVILTFDLMTPKSIGIIYGSWPFMIPRKVHIGKIKLMRGQNFANGGQTDGRTDDMCHNIIRPKIPSGV